MSDVLWQPEHPGGHAPFCVKPYHSLAYHCSASEEEPQTLRGEPSKAWQNDHHQRWWRARVTSRVRRPDGEIILFSTEFDISVTGTGAAGAARKAAVTRLGELYNDPSFLTDPGTADFNVEVWPSVAPSHPLYRGAAAERRRNMASSAKKPDKGAE